MDIISRIKGSTDMISAMLNQLNTGLYVIDSAYHIESFNAHFDETTSDSLVHTSCHFCDSIVGCLHMDEPSDNNEHCDFCSQCEVVHSIKLALEAHTESCDVPIVRHHGTRSNPIRKYYKYTCKPMDLEGETVALLMIEDITKVEQSRAELYEKHQMITKYNERYQHDLALAKLVQKSIIPMLPIKKGDYNIDFLYYPLDEIGGDMFDIIEIDDAHIGVFMCDVIGHGLPAALVTTMIKALLAGNHDALRRPQVLMNRLNASLINMVTDPYMTAFYGVINLVDDSFTFVRAGHPYPWLIAESGVQTLGYLSNPMIGLSEDIAYDEAVIHIEPKSKIMIYTDGLLEISTRDNSYEKQVLAFLESHPDASGEQLLLYMKSDLEMGIKNEKYTDDVCILMIERD